MRKVITGGIAVTLGVGTALASGAWAGTADGQGAQKRALVVNGGGTGESCHADGSNASGGPSGFAILNMPGKVGATDRIVGEVSLKNDVDDAGQVLGVYLAQPGSGEEGTCVLVGMLTPNDEGNGNAHIDTARVDGLSATPGQYYVVIKDAAGSQEKFASSLVNLK